MYRVMYRVAQFVDNYDESCVVDNLDGVVVALGAMSRNEDNIVIMELRSGGKVGVWWRSPDYILEVIRADGVFSRCFAKDQLIASLKDIENIVVDPLAYGFDAESL